MSTTQKEPDAELQRLKDLLEEERRRRLQAEEAVRQSEAYHHLLLESAPVAIAIYSYNKFVFSNKAHRKIMGAADPSALIGRNVLDVIEESCHQLFLRRQKVVLDEGADSNNFIMMNASLLGRFWNDLLPVLDTIHRDRGEPPPTISLTHGKTASPPCRKFFDLCNRVPDVSGVSWFQVSDRHSG